MTMLRSALALVLRQIAVAFIVFNYGYLTLDEGGTRCHSHGISIPFLWNVYGEEI